MRVFELEDVISLLRSEVKRAGSQAAWSKKTGVSRIKVNQVLNGHKSPTAAIIGALKLRWVIVAKPKSSKSAARPSRNK
jgi:hypothetical protein